MRIAILGRTEMLFDSIDALINSGNEIVLIGTCKSSPESKIKEDDFEKKAKELEVPFFNSARINTLEIITLLKSVNADIAVSMNWLTIIGEDAVNSFEYGILNAHCGDLPRYRGNACPNWAILQGETNYAITIHYMNPGELDSGDIILKEFFPITLDTTITDIYEVMQSNIPRMFCKAVEHIENGNCTGRKQSRRKEDSLRCYPLIPTDSFIDWNASCDEIMCLIRASCWPFEGAFTYYNSLKVHIMSAVSKPYDAPCFVKPGQIIKIEKDKWQIEIAAKDGIIVIEEVYIDGRKYKATDVFKSIRIRLNYCVQSEIYQLRKQMEDLKRELDERLK